MMCCSPFLVLHRPSCQTGILGEGVWDGGDVVPVRRCVGDQQAALLGQQCLEQGASKQAFGAGEFYAA